MNHKSRPVFIAWRFYLLIAVVVLAAAGLCWRVFDLAILDRHFLQREGDERVLRMVNTPAFRGMIVDRNGSPLAVSTRVYSVWMNPQEFAPSSKEAHALAKLLEIKSSRIYALIEKNKKSKREFIYLKRGQPPTLATQIKAMQVRGLHTQEEYRRYYPEGEVTAHVVGFTNIDDRGQEGFELAYNDWLAGEPGKKWVIKDRLGRIISDVQVVQNQRAGHDLMLSIDRRIQYLAYRELLKGVTENKARSGSAVVLDAKTGEILAMVNVPSYNPNNRPLNMGEKLRNRAVTDTFEPASTVKPFGISLALASKKISPSTMIDTSPGWMRVGKNIVRDHENKASLSVADIIKKSSNVGVTKIMLNQSPNAYWSLMDKVGFGQPTEIRFPGEQSGSLVHHNPWGQFVYATMTIGYGMSSTTLQLARSYLVFANEGKRLPVSLLRLEKAPDGKQVLNPAVVKQMTAMMEEVVQKGGTAPMVNVPGYRIAAKTGTAHIASGGKYLKHSYNSVFVGIAPISNPRLIIAVMVSDPQGRQYYGGFVSGPVFSHIMEGTLRLLDVPPDDLKSLASQPNHTNYA